MLPAAAPPERKRTQPFYTPPSTQPACASRPQPTAEPCPFVPKGHAPFEPGSRGGPKGGYYVQNPSLSSPGSPLRHQEGHRRGRRRGNRKLQRLHVLVESALFLDYHGRRPPLQRGKSEKGQKRKNTSSSAGWTKRTFPPSFPPSKKPTPMKNRWWTW